MASAPVVGVCKSTAVTKTEAIEWHIDAWSSLPSEHVAGAARKGRTVSETMQAAGDKWAIQVVP